MKIIVLYKYQREDGGTTVSLTKPKSDYTEKYRLVADEGMNLTQDGITYVPCVDVESLEGWYEVANSYSEV